MEIIVNIRNVAHFSNGNMPTYMNECLCFDSHQ